MSGKTLNKKRMDQRSYLLSMLFVFPLFIISTALGRAYDSAPYETEQGFASMARMVALALMVVVVVWTTRRLHDAGRSGWFSLLLIPPATLFFLIYALVAPAKNEDNKWGEASTQVRVFGIKAKGVLRITGIVFIAIFASFVSLVFYSVLIGI